MKVKRRVKVGMLSPKEKLARKKSAQRNRAKNRKRSKMYYKKNKSKIKMRRKRSKGVMGPKPKAGVKYKFA